MDNIWYKIRPSNGKWLEPYTPEGSEFPVSEIRKWRHTIVSVWDGGLLLKKKEWSERTDQNPFQRVGTATAYSIGQAAVISA